MNSISFEYSSYLNSPLEKVAYATLGKKYIGQTSSQSWEELQFILTHLPSTLLPSNRILDLGCGNGCFSLLLARHFNCSVTGIDISSKSILAASIKLSKDPMNSRVHFIHGDFNQLSFAPQSFELLIAIGSLYWTDNLADLTNHWQSCITYGGSLVLINNLAIDTLDANELAAIDNTRFVNFQELIDLLRKFASAPIIIDLSDAYGRWLQRWCKNLENFKEELTATFGHQETGKILRRFNEYSRLHFDKKVQRYAIIAANRSRI